MFNLCLVCVRFVFGLCPIFPILSNKIEVQWEPKWEPRSLKSHMSGPLSQAASVTNNHLSYPLKLSFSRFLKPLAPQTIISQAPLSLESLSDFTSFIGFPCSEPSFFTPSQFLSPKLPQAPGPSSHPVHDHRTETGATGWPLAALQIQRRS